MTNDQDKAIEAIMNREGYAAVEPVDTGNPEIACIVEQGGTSGHFIRTDGAECLPRVGDGILILGYPAHEVLAMNPAEHRMFFYGTLMSGHGRDGWMRRYGKPVGRGTLRGDMYQVNGGGFPCFVTGEGTVHGEVWEADSPGALAAMIRECDNIEGYIERSHTGMYLRERHTLLSGEGDASEGDEVWVYRWNSGHLYLGPPVPDGDWRVIARERAAEYERWLEGNADDFAEGAE
jgi:gamma-glutamylcyclotransferase (GGCT)/AIG2-like uncharacterized protein YtfP